METQSSEPKSVNVIEGYKFTKANDLFFKSLDIFKQKFDQILPFFLILATYQVIYTIILKLVPSLSLILAFPNVVISIYIYAINQIAIILIISTNSTDDFNAIIARANGLVVKYIIVSFQVFIRVLLWTLLLIIPGIIFAFLYSFSYMALIIEGKESKDALLRSKELIKKNYKQLVYKSLYLFLWIIIVSALSLVLASILKSFSIGSYVYSLISLILTEISLIYYYFLYREMAGLNS